MSGITRVAKFKSTEQPKHQSSDSGWHEPQNPVNTSFTADISSRAGGCQHNQKTHSGAASVHGEASALFTYPSFQQQNNDFRLRVEPATTQKNAQHEARQAPILKHLETAALDGIEHVSVTISRHAANAHTLDIATARQQQDNRV